MYFWTVCSKCSNGVDHKLFLRWKINCIVTTFLPTYLFTQMHFWDPLLNFRNLSLMELKSSCNVLSNGMLELLKSWASTFISSIERNFYSWLKRLGKLFSLFSRNFYTVAGVTNYVKAIHIGKKKLNMLVLVPSFQPWYWNFVMIFFHHENSSNGLERTLLKEVILLSSKGSYLKLSIPFLFKKQVPSIVKFSILPIAIGWIGNIKFFCLFLAIVFVRFSVTETIKKTFFQLQVFHLKLSSF